MKWQIYHLGDEVDLMKVDEMTDHHLGEEVDLMEVDEAADHYLKKVFKCNFLEKLSCSTEFLGK